MSPPRRNAQVSRPDHDPEDDENDMDGTPTNAQCGGVSSGYVKLYVLRSLLDLFLAMVVFWSAFKFYGNCKQ